LFDLAGGAGTLQLTRLKIEFAKQGDVIGQTRGEKQRQLIGKRQVDIVFAVRHGGELREVAGGTDGEVVRKILFQEDWPHLLLTAGFLFPGHRHLERHFMEGFAKLIEPWRSGVTGGTLHIIFTCPGWNRLYLWDEQERQHLDKNTQQRNHRREVFAKAYTCSGHVVLLSRWWLNTQ
jgi:hypothetical protein